LHFFLLDIIVIFVVFVILIIEIELREVVTKALVMAWAVVKITGYVLESNTAKRNYCEFF